MGFYNISKDEMHEFLTQREFKPMSLPKTSELVYGKIVYKDNYRLSIRVYTGILPSGESRPKGKDAIRVCLYFMYKDKPTPVGKNKTCKRVTNWKANLTKAIDSWEDSWKLCPACSNPMALRESKFGGTFWGCVTYFDTKCKGSVKV